METVKPSLKEKQWKLREDTILDSASDLMATKGFNAMTMDDVANLVGISKATLYQHFSSKHDLAVSVACRAVDQAYERMTSIDASLPAVKRLEQLIDGIIELRLGPGRPPVVEVLGELINVLPGDHPFIVKEQRNFKFISNLLTEVSQQNGLTPGVAVFVAVQVIDGVQRCTEFERAIEDRLISSGEIAASVKNMLIRQ